MAVSTEIRTNSASIEIEIEVEIELRLSLANTLKILKGSVLFQDIRESLGLYIKIKRTCPLQDCHQDFLS